MFRNITGQKFGRLTAVQYDCKANGFHLWKCHCDCGAERTVRESNLMNGNSRSCGCLQKEIAASENTVHSMVESPEYNSWRGAKERCTNQNHIEYHIYGGRGVTMCERWLNSFAAFLEDMGRKPSPKHSIDRFPNNSGNYEPGNCRWATSKEQAENRRITLRVELHGTSITIKEFSERTGIPYSTVRWRSLHGKELIPDGN